MFDDWIKIALGALVAVANLVPLAEGKGSGADKKQFVINATNAIVNSALTASGNPTLNDQGNQLINVLAGTTTDLIVSLLNTSGQFTHAPVLPSTPADPKDNVIPMPAK